MVCDTSTENKMEELKMIMEVVDLWLFSLFYLWPGYLSVFKREKQSNSIDHFCI